MPSDFANDLTDHIFACVNLIDPNGHEKVARAIDFNVGFLPPSESEDFSSLVLIESLDALKKQPSDRIGSIIRAVNKAKQQIRRAFNKHSRHLQLYEVDVIATNTDDPDSKFMQGLYEFLVTRGDLDDLFLFDALVLQELSPSSIMKTLKLSTATFYRRKNKLKEIIGIYLENHLKS